MQEEYTYTPTLFSHDTEYLNNSPVSLNEDEIDSSIRDSLCKLKNLHPFETTCQTSLRKLPSIPSPTLKKPLTRFRFYIHNREEIKEWISR